MFHKKKIKILLIAMFIVFSITFYFGVFANPNFNIHEFCMNLASEILGLVITVVIVDTYMEEKRSKRKTDGNKRSKE